MACRISIEDVIEMVQSDDIEIAMNMEVGESDSDDDSIWNEK